jgi:hypothetical protein
LDWEKWLQQAARPPSESEEAKAELTERQIRSALDASAALKGKPWRVYIKGSYANNTNVRLDYDVDIAVEWYGFFYYDLVLDAKDKTASDVGIVPNTDTYTRADFKRDVEAALVARFGRSAVQPGDIALRIREQQTRLPADVVPCWEYRRYDGFDHFGRPIEKIGSRVYPKSGGWKNNFPQYQLDNGIIKNNATGRRYKRMVRGFKKLQTHLLERSLIDEELPSYLSECLVYNVPNPQFRRLSYLADMQSVLAYLYNGLLSSGDSDDWLEVHELHYLFRGQVMKSKADVRAVLDAAWTELGFS